MFRGRVLRSEGARRYDGRMTNASFSAVEPVLTALQSRVARDIVSLARRDNLKAGDHLVESTLARDIGTSRSPVNAALRYLVAVGVVAHDLNRGYFLSRDASDLGELADQFSAEPDDPLYLRIAEERLARALPDEVGEIDLMRRYAISRSALRKVLARIQKEGWIEKSVGHGWVFQPMIDSNAAYEENYLFRVLLEPAALQSERFRVDPEALARLRRQQEFIAAEGYERMTAIELFEANSGFHEVLAGMSGNRFILQSLRRANQLRRLVEYRHAASGREARRVQIVEHLAILDAIEAGNMAKAATLMRQHLEGARQAKVVARNVFL